MDRLGVFIFSDVAGVGKSVRGGERGVPWYTLFAEGGCGV